MSQVEEAEAYPENVLRVAVGERLREDSCLAQWERQGTPICPCSLCSCKQAPAPL